MLGYSEPVWFDEGKDCSVKTEKGEQVISLSKQCIFMDIQ